MRVLREKLSIHSSFSQISGKGNLIDKENAKSICGIQSVFNCYKKVRRREICVFIILQIEGLTETVEAWNLKNEDHPTKMSQKWSNNTDYLRPFELL